MLDVLEVKSEKWTGVSWCDREEDAEEIVGQRRRTFVKQHVNKEGYLLFPAMSVV